MAKTEQKQVFIQRLPSGWLRRLFIGYGVCFLLAIIGVILGAVNFVAGPVHYPAFVLVLWLLVNIFLLAVVALHLLYFVVEMMRSDPQGESGPAIPMFIMFIAFPTIIAGSMILLYKHFGWFSMGVLVALGICMIATTALFLGRKG